MNTSPFNPDMVCLLQHWIDERERCRQQHDAKPQPPRPWTNDPVLQRYSFCNVRRMDDKVSRWLMNKWYVNAAPYTALVVQATIARLINWPATLAHFLAPVRERWTASDETRLTAVLEKLWNMKGRDNVFGNAYLVVGTEFGQQGGKVAAVPRIVTRAAAVAPAVAALRMMERQHAELCKVRGLGSFLAGQIVADLRHLRGAHWAVDRMVWAPIGPGSARGMARLLGRPVRPGSVRAPAFVPLLARLRDELRLPPNVEAMDLQNCLCEFDKYCRAVVDGRRPHRLYRGGVQ